MKTSVVRKSRKSEENKNNKTAKTENKITVILPYVDVV